MPTSYEIKYILTFKQIWKASFKFKILIVLQVLRRNWAEKGQQEGSADPSAIFLPLFSPIPCCTTRGFVNICLDIPACLSKLIYTLPDSCCLSTPQAWQLSSWGGMNKRKKPWRLRKKVSIFWAEDSKILYKAYGQAPSRYSPLTEGLLISCRGHSLELD